MKRLFVPLVIVGTLAAPGVAGAAINDPQPACTINSPCEPAPTCTINSPCEPINKVDNGKALGHVKHGKVASR